MNFLFNKFNFSLELKKYISNTSWLFIEKAITLPISLLLNIIVTRYLGPENLGLLSYSQSFVTIFAIIAGLGIDQIVTRDLVRNLSKQNYLLGTGFIIKLGGSILLIISTLFASIIIKNNTYSNLIIFVIAFSYIFQSFFVIDLYFQSQVISKYSVYSRVIAFFVTSVLKIIFIFLNFSLFWFALAIIIENLVTGISYLIYFIKQKQNPFQWKFNSTVFKYLLKESWPIAFMGITIHIQAYIDQVILGKLVSNYEVGQYSAAINLITVFSFIPSIIYTSFTAAITNAKKISKDLYYFRLLNIYRLMFILFLCVSLPIFFFAKDLIVFLNGKEFAPAGILLSLFAIRLFFTNFGMAKTLYVLNENLFRYSLLASLIGTIINVALNFILIPYFHAIGSIIAMIVSFAFTTFIIDAFVKEMRENLKLMLKGIFTFYKIEIQKK